MGFKNFYGIVGFILLLLLSSGLCTFRTRSLNSKRPRRSAVTSRDSVEDISKITTTGWENVHIKLESRVAGLPTWVDQKASNTRQCLRMCWLYSACAAVTFTLSQHRCLLYSSDSAPNVYRTLPEKGSMAVDMRNAGITSGVNRLHLGEKGHTL